MMNNSYDDIEDVSKKSSKRKLTPQEREERRKRKEERRRQDAIIQKRELYNRRKENDYIQRTYKVNPQKVRERADKTVYTILVIILLLLMVAVIRIAIIQFGPRGQKWRALIERKYVDVTPLRAERGRIISSDGAILTQSVQIHNVSVDFNTVRDKDFTPKNIKKISKVMSEQFPTVSASEYENRLRRWRKLRKTRNIIPRNKTINSLKLSAIDTLPIFRNSKYSGGLIVRTTVKREGIYGNLAKRVLGRVPDTINGKKSFGIEDSFDKELRGKDGVDVRRRFAKNLWTPVTQECSPAENGADVVTTLDSRIQYYTHYALKKAILKYQAIRGTMVVMDVETGEIKAMSNLARTKDDNVVENYNYAIGMLMCIEPGSTLKMMTLMQLLDHTPTELTDSVHTTNHGVKYFHGARVSDTHGYGDLTLQQAFEKSSNIGFAEATLRYFDGEPDKYLELMKERGIDKPFNLGIDGEIAPYRDDAGAYVNKKTDMVVLSYGYGYKFTPLRTLMYYNAVANNGKMVAPHLVKRVEKNGDVIEKFGTEVLNNNICKPSTVDKLKQAMEGVVLYGTGRQICSPYFRIAGKTGTARIYQSGGYGNTASQRHYLASFCGYYPAEKPKYSCIVAVETTGDKVYYGISLAGTPFKEVANKIYKLGGEWTEDVLPPIRTRENDENSVDVIESIDNSVFVARGTEDRVDDIIDILDIKNKHVKMMGTEGEEVSDEGVPMDIMPDVIGMGLRDAVYILEKRGLRVEAVGKGVVRKQSIHKGTKISKRNYVRIILR